MTASPDNRSDAESIKVPESLDDLNDLMREAVIEYRKIDGLEATRKRRKTRVDEQIDASIKPLQARLDRLLPVILMYIRANRNRLLQGGKRKTLETADVIVEFRRDGKGTLTFKREDEASIVANLEKRRGSKQFVKVVKTVKKDPLKKWLLENRRRRVPGVQVVFKNSLALRLKPTTSEKRRGVKPVELVREIDD